MTDNYATPSTASRGGQLADGEWHRLHPASPLLKGGIAFLAIIGVVIANLRERLFDMFLPRYSYEGDPVDYVIDNGLLGLFLVAVLVFLLIMVAGFYVSWRMHMFRITDEVVEVRSGILFRTNRKARLDRIQGINIVRPLFARIFGAAKLEISQAGQDANVQLSYLGSSAADDLRREILRLASGTRETRAAAQAPSQPPTIYPVPSSAVADDTAAPEWAPPTGVAQIGAAPVNATPYGANPYGAAVGAPGAPAAAGAAASVINRRVNEFLAPELDPDAAQPESIVKLHLGRLIGSLVLSSTTVMILIFAIASIVFVVLTGEFFALFFLFPAVIGFGSFYVRRFTKSLRYTIAGTPDGIRVGFGLLSTSNETLPPGRIHSVQVSQPLLWRGPGWWEIKVNRASHSSTKGAAGEENTTILPVGNRDDVRKVLALILPELLVPAVDANGESTLAINPIEAGLQSKGHAGDGFTNSPPRAAILRWFSWRRNGFAITPGSLVLRKGAIWRQLVIVPQPRLQSVSVHQGPLLRLMRLATVHLHTVSGPINAELGAIDRDAAVQFFDDVSRVAVSAAQSDTTHRWRAGEQPA